MRRNRLLLAYLAAVACLAGIEALRMTALRVPKHVVFEKSVKMECDFDLDQETLYSVKWYKDGHEFYRYVPNEDPPVHVFRLDGVLVDKQSSTDRSVQLHPVNRASTGRYRCEVSSEAPFFYTVSDHADMIVVMLPANGPTIAGVKLKYQVDDVVRANCTSSPSKPAATLAWYVNDQMVDRRYVKGPRVIRAGRNSDLEISQLGLVFNVTSRHFHKDELRLKCLATISTVYKRSKLVRASADDKFLKQPMESRETRAQSHTRVEPANGVKSCTSSPGPPLLTTILSALSILALAPR